MLNKSVGRRSDSTKDENEIISNFFIILESASDEKHKTKYARVDAGLKFPVVGADICLAKDIQQNIAIRKR